MLFSQDRRATSVGARTGILRCYLRHVYWLTISKFVLCGEEAKASLIPYNSRTFAGCLYMEVEQGGRYEHLNDVRRKLKHWLGISCWNLINKVILKLVGIGLLLVNDEFAFRHINIK